jgi:hypothetical protein
MTQVVVEAGKAYILPRVLAESTGPAALRAYIESNLAFMREHRNYMVAVVEILRNGTFTTDAGRPGLGTGRRRRAA